MTPDLVALLAVLALVDSASIGTLVLPVWLMLAPGRLRASRVIVLLATVAGAYLALGVLLTAGVFGLLDNIPRSLDTTPMRIIQLAVGVGLLVAGTVMEPWSQAGKDRALARREARRALRGPSRLYRWRTAAFDGSSSLVTLAGLALTAVALEAVSMVPYLAAIALLASAALPLPATALTLAGYCLVMIAPACVLLLLRALFSHRLTPFLTRLEAWLSRNVSETTAWVVALLGLFVAGDAAQALWLGS